MVTAGEKNTWPSIPRIRAHCLVEITLDKCVQRLRKRIAEETSSPYLDGQTDQSSARLNDGSLGVTANSSFRSSKKMDRTPSFYTSRSIVNLSGQAVRRGTPFSYCYLHCRIGLSVADPQPSQLHSLLQDRRLSGFGSLKGYFNHWRCKCIRFTRRSIVLTALATSDEHTDPFVEPPREEDPLTLSVHVGERPMGADKSSLRSSSSSSFGRRSRSNSVASNGRSTDSLKDYDGQIHK